MKFTLYDTIWVAIDLNSYEAIAATRSYDDLIETLCAKGYINERFYLKNHKTVKELFGEKWKETLKKFSAKKLEDLAEDWEVILRQVELKEKIK